MTKKTSDNKLQDLNLFKDLKNLFIDVLSQKYNKSVSIYLVISTFLSVFVAVLQATYPILFAMSIDLLSNETINRAKSYLFIIASVFSFVLAKLLVEQRWLIYQPAEIKFLNGVRKIYLSHVLSLPLDFHLNRSIGKLNTIVGQGMSGLQSLLSTVLIQLAPLFFEIVATTISLIVFVDWRVALCVLITIIIYVFVLVLGAELTSKHLGTALKTSINAQGAAGDAVLNAEGIKTLAIENGVLRRYLKLLAISHRAFSKFYKSRGLLGICLTLVLSIGFALSVLIVFFEILAGNLSVGALVATNTYVLLLFRSMDNLSYAYRDLRQSLTYLNKFLSLLASKPEPSEYYFKDLNNIDQIEFQNVNFTYDNDSSDDILTNVNLTVKKHFVTIIIGQSGSGKSTLVRLIFKLLNPTKGSIFVDGQNILHVNKKSLRNKIAVVPQDAVMFDATLKFNITLSEKTDTMLLNKVLYDARLTDVVNNLPDGLETKIGERGLMLSGGERQRVAIARALYRQPEILIFDESTSALDETNAKEILSMISELKETCGILIITHDPKIAELADLVVDLDAVQSDFKGR